MSSVLKELTDCTCCAKGAGRNDFDAGKYISRANCPSNGFAGIKKPSPSAL